MSKRIDKYPPDGHLSECKKCLTRHVDNWDPQTFLWILEEIDVPYIEDEWTKLMDKYCQDRTKVTGTTILGRYLSKMKLKQFKDKHWSDTAKIKAEQDQKKKDAMIYNRLLIPEQCPISQKVMCLRAPPHKIMCPKALIC